ncbi:MAG: FG-GAP repeat protein, partial [Phycisphaerales bacterium]
MRKGPIGVLSIVGATLLNGAAWGQCEVAQIFSQGSFGRVSVSGNVAVISDTEAFGSLGAAFVYRRGPGGPGDWKLDAVLMAPEPDVDDVFGFAVAVSGDVIVVGAPSAYIPKIQSGASYIYRFDPDISQWAYEATLTASGFESAYLFGFSVSIDGNVALIGARDAEIAGMYQAGSAYVFRY